MTATALQRHLTATTIAYRAEGMPPGIVGQLEGVALVYDTFDSYGTTFARGCLDRTRRERVAGGKVKLFWDHGDMPIQGSYDTDLHIGLVRSIDDREVDGRTVAWLKADIFDTEEGRRAHEYLRAVFLSGGETGLSVNFDPPLDDNGRPTPTRYIDKRIDGVDVRTFTEIPLREISVTAESSVPGTRVKKVRANAGTSGDARIQDSDAASGPPAATDSNADASDSQPATSEVARIDHVPLTDRLQWARRAFARLYPDGTDD